jgi:uncharacterized protein (TIGR03435 family)
LSLADLVRTAYRMKPYQVTGPEWMSSVRFDIMAKLPEGASKDKVPEMLQTLLADRFKMVSHREDKEHPAYALLVGKGGPKLKEADPESAVQPVDKDAPPPKGALVMGSGEYQVRVQPTPGATRAATVSSPQFGEMKISMGEGGMMRMEFSSMTMQNLADTLSRYTDKPVLDLTELKGKYQITLNLSLEDLRAVAMAAGMGPAMGPGGGMGRMRPGGGGGPQASSPADSASTPGGSIFTAIQALGLKLEPRKMPVETLIIDHLEKAPTEN